jgi:hypothetical protein
VAGQLADWYLIGRLLKLDDLLVDELRLLVYDEIGVERTLFCGVTGRPGPAALPRECHTAESSEDMDILDVVAGSALDVECCGLGRHDGGADDNTRYPHQPRDGKGVQVADRDIFGVGVQQQLVLRQLDVGLVGINDSVCTPLQGSFELDGVRTLCYQGGVVMAYKWDNFGGFCHQSVGDLLVELDQVANVDVAVVLL